MLPPLSETLLAHLATRLLSGDGPGGHVALVCGSRDYTAANQLNQAMDQLHQLLRFSLIITGDGPSTTAFGTPAQGGCLLAFRWALAQRIPTLAFHWQLADGQQMLAQTRPSLVIAFLQARPPGKPLHRYDRAARRLIKLATATDLPVVEIVRNQDEPDRR